MSRRHRPNPSQGGLFADVPLPPRGPGNRARLKKQWEETGRGEAEAQAELLRGILIDRLDGKLEEFMELFQDDFGLDQSRAMTAFQKIQEALFPEAFDIDLDTERRKQGMVPRCGGEKVTAAQLAALAGQLRAGG